VFLEHPLIRPYFYEDLPVPGNNEEMRHRVLAAAEFVLDVFECIWDHKAQFSKRDRVAWQEWIVGVFETSPAVRGLYRNNAGWYPTLSELVSDADWNSKDLVL